MKVVPPQYITTGEKDQKLQAKNIIVLGHAYLV